MSKDGLTTIEHGAVVPQDDTAIAKVYATDDVDGVFALASMSETEFERRLTMMKLGRDRVKRVQQELMTDGVDYGMVPGTKKPSLLKPGAETLCKLYHVVPAFDMAVNHGDGERLPDIGVRAVCYLHQGSKAGPIVGEGIGSANSFEKKYRYRAAQKACPSCGCEGTIRRSKFADRDSRDGSKGWYCHDKAGGCGAQFKADDKAIVGQEGGQIDNPDPHDVENTLLKMAAKRAQVDAVLRYTATSGLFTQDIEDDVDDKPSRDAGKAQESGTAGRQPAQTPRSEPAAANGTRTATTPQNGNGVPAAGNISISGSQSKAFWTWVRQQGFEDLDVVEHIKKTYGVSLTTDLTIDQLGAVRAHLVATKSTRASGSQPAGDREPGSDG